MCAFDYLDVASIEKKCSYRLGDSAKACDVRTPGSEKDNVSHASSLEKGDGAFVLRSDNTWRFAIVTQKVLDEEPHIDFILNDKGSMKCLSFKRWASNIRSFQSSRSGKMNQFMDSLDSYSEIAEETKEEIATSQCLKELVTSQCLNELNLSMLANAPSVQEDGLDDSRRTSAPSSGWNQPLPPEITVQRRVRNKERSSSFDSTATTNMNDRPAATKEDTDQPEITVQRRVQNRDRRTSSFHSTATKNMNDRDASTNEDTDREQGRKNKSWDTQPFLQSEPEASKASRKDETRRRDRKSCPDILSYQQVKSGQTTTKSKPEGSKSSCKDETRSRDRKSCPDIISCQQVKPGQTPTRKMRRNTFTPLEIRRKTATPLDKTNEEKRKMKSLRASVSCPSVTKFQSLFEECMHA